LTGLSACLRNKESNSKPYNELFVETNDVVTGTTTRMVVLKLAACVIPKIKVFIMSTLNKEFDFKTMLTIDANCDGCVRVVFN